VKPTVYTVDTTTGEDVASRLRNEVVKLRDDGHRIAENPTLDIEAMRSALGDEILKPFERVELGLVVSMTDTRTGEDVVSPLPDEGSTLHGYAPFTMRNALQSIADRVKNPDDLEFLVSLVNTMKNTTALAMLVQVVFYLGLKSALSEPACDYALALAKGEIARNHGRVRGRAASAKKRQAVADERDRAAFRDRWWEKRGKYLQAGMRPRTTKNDLINKIVVDLEEKGGGRGSGERTVRGAINRWEKNLLAKPTGKIAGREITPECDRGGA
jgi:hypothetical protein